MVVTVKGAVAVVAVPAIASILGIIWFQRKRQKHLSSSDRSEKFGVDDTTCLNCSNHVTESLDSFDSGKVSQPDSQELENGSSWSSMDDNGSSELMNSSEFCDESLRSHADADKELFEQCLADKCNQILSSNLHLSIEDRLSSGYDSLSRASTTDTHCNDCCSATEHENLSPGDSSRCFNGDNFAGGFGDNNFDGGFVDSESKNAVSQCFECIDVGNSSFLESADVLSDELEKNVMVVPSGELLTVVLNERGKDKRDETDDVVVGHGDIVVEENFEALQRSSEESDTCLSFTTFGNSDVQEASETQLNMCLPESESADILEISGTEMQSDLDENGSVDVLENCELKEEQAAEVQDAFNGKLSAELNFSACYEMSGEAVCLSATNEESTMPTLDESSAARCSVSEDGYNVASSVSGVSGYEAGVYSLDDPMVSMLNFVREFEFPSHLCGMLIGKNGRTIRNVSKRTKTVILVQPHPSKDCKVIYVRGCSGEDVEEAFATISGMFPDEELRWPEYAYIPTFQQEFCNIDNTTVLVVSIVTANHIFLQTPEQVQEVALLTQAMNYHYNCSVGEPLDASICEHTLCAASLGGSNWFRAELVESYPDQNVCVLKFVDVGGYAMTSISHLKKLRDDFMAVPYQATECYLYDILPPHGEEVFRYGTVTFLESMVRGVHLMCKVNCYAADGVPCVTLFVFHSDMMVNVNQQLIWHGYAVPS